jgi:multidrug resistance efflux pump
MRSTKAAPAAPLVYISLLVLPLLCASLAACSRAGAQASAPAESAGVATGGGAAAELIVHHGTLQPRLLLTGELEAKRADALSVPQTPSFQVQIKWMAEDGTLVAAGQPVVEFDNSAFTQQLEEKRLAATDAASQLERTMADAATQEADKRFAIDQKRADLAKAQMAAAVPSELVPLWTYQDRQLTLERARAELAKAESDLDAQHKAAAADVAVQRIALDKARREIATAEGAIQALTLKAPRAGIVLASMHPWEGRKIQAGDNVWTGLAVATIPDLSVMRVQAALSDVDDGRIAPGMPVRCTLDAYPGETFLGRIAEISPVARELDRNPVLRYFPVRIELARGDPRRMRPGMSVRVEVETGEVRDAVLAPRAGLALGGAGAARGRGRARLAAGGSVEVRLGACSAAECVVLGGLAPGQRLRAPGAAS